MKINVDYSDGQYYWYHNYTGVDQWNTVEVADDIVNLWQAIGEAYSRIQSQLRV